jgi:hypothetical protein
MPTTIFNIMGYINDFYYDKMEEQIQKQLDKKSDGITICILSQPIKDFSVFKNINKLWFTDYYFPLDNLPEHIIEIGLQFKNKYEHKLDNLPPKLKLLEINYRNNYFDIILDHLPQNLQILQITSTVGFLHEFDNLPNNLRLFMCGNATTDNFELDNEFKTSLKVTFNLPDTCIAILRRDNYVSRNKNTIVYVNHYSDYHFMNYINYN